MRNPVAKNLYTFNKPSVIASKQRKLKSEATLRDAAQSLSEEVLDSETMCFDGGCNGHLNDLGCSSISIDCEEEDGK
jgi:hypothetical protein